MDSRTRVPAVIAGIETKSEPIIWDIGDEEEEYPFVNKYLSFQEEPIVLVEEKSCPVYDTDNEEEESMLIYDTDIEDVIEEEEGFFGKGGFGGEEDNIEYIVVVANDICSSMIQTTLSVDVEEDVNTKLHELMSFGKRIIIKEMLRNCHGHNLSKGNIIKIFYYGLNEITQEVLNAAAGGNSNSDTDKIMARMDAMTIKMDAMTIKMDALYKELQSRAKQPTPDLDDDDIPISHEEEAKFMQTFRKTCFYNDYRDRDSNRDNWHSSGRNDYNRDNYRSYTDDKSYHLQRQFNDFMKCHQSTNAFVKETFMDLKTQLETVAKNHQASIQNLETKFDRLADKQSGRPFGSLPSNTQPNP
ncbi:hypothetical protein Tco_0302843 [Tanacetum coccineum]